MKQYQLTAREQQGRMVILTMRPSAPRGRIEFRAGQYVAVGFRRFGRRSPMRCFSLVNTPNASGELQIAFREQGDFTAALSGLRPGAELFVGGPYGSFSVPAGQDRPLVYLAAGIGITPFMSLLRDQVRRGSQVPVTLLYSSRTLNDTPFAAELLQMAKDYPWLTVRFLVGQVPGTFRPHPAVISGKLNQEVIAEFCDDSADYYVCGSSGYNKRTAEILAEHGVLSMQINTEAFGQGSKLRVAGFAVQKLVYSLTAALLMVGIGGVFTLDNLGHKSHVASAATQSANTDTSLSTPSDTTSSGSDDTSNAGDTNNTHPNVPSPSYNYTEPSPHYTYQPPVSSVS